MPRVIDVARLYPEDMRRQEATMVVGDTQSKVRLDPATPRQIKSIVRRSKQHGSVVDSLKALLFKPKRRNSVQFTVTQTYVLPPRLSATSSDLYYTKSELRDIQLAARTDGDDAMREEIPEGTVRVQSFLTVLVAHPSWKASASSRTYYVTLKDHSLYLHRSAAIAQINQPEYQLDVVKAVDPCEPVGHTSINQELSLQDIAYTFAVVDAQDLYAVFAADSTKSKSAWLTGLQHNHLALPRRQPSPIRLSKQRSS
ncbi:hypothetical protein H310_04549 [Aphanomyces invadans]|uniref:PH domain-containing protein n=1 Tax=Aphanomyces invadans TaxID=157072 RepID=A0A024UCQ5_9STRA|nr:hypothetical protein H310_04549 [Aphanomyces invadans]ETW04206.1 hypothetical protein H310_04549 [Aphanomyces invadans]|eukprot:XP_008867162.1 hypothetical protein H310_04549 [Aphanomyces invadans]